jgi:hypothetical protein
MKERGSASSILKMEADVWYKTLRFFQIPRGCSSQMSRCVGEMFQFLPVGNFEFYGQLKR